MMPKTERDGPMTGSRAAAIFKVVRSGTVPGLLSLRRRAPDGHMSGSEAQRELSRMLTAVGAREGDEVRIEVVRHTGHAVQDTTSTRGDR